MPKDTHPLDHAPMDRPRRPESPWSTRRIALLSLAALGIVAAIVADRLWLRAPVGIVLADYATADVRRGALSIEVQGAGALEPVSERWVTADVQGTVQEVLARPGERITQGEGIVRLANPHLRRQLAQARLALAEIEAEDRRHAAEVIDRRLAAEARLLSAKADHEEQALRLRAQEELREQNAVSEVELRSQQIRTGQASAQAAFEERRFEELQAALRAEREASEARVAARRAALGEAQADLASLVVTVEAAGTVRELLVDPGAHVAAGAQVARLVDTSSLTAVIRVPEFYAGHLTAGQPAIARVLSADIHGTLARVDPAVTEGTVAVDIELQGPLPTGARPDLSVRATVTVAELTDVLYVRRPMHVRDHSTTDVFVLSEKEGSARRTAVRFGMGTPSQVEAIEGLREGDTLLLGNPARLEGLDVVAVR